MVLSTVVPTSFMVVDSLDKTRRGQFYRPRNHNILSISNYLKYTEHFPIVTKEKYSRTKDHIQNGYTTRVNQNSKRYNTNDSNRGIHTRSSTTQDVICVMSGHKDMPNCVESYKTSCKLHVLYMLCAAGCSTIFKLEQVS